MKTSGINGGLTSPLGNVVNGKRAFISERPDELDISNFLTIPNGDNR